MSTSGALNGVKLELVDSMEMVGEFKRWLGERHELNTIAWDTETPGLNAYCGKPVRLIQFGDTMNGWAIPWELWGGVALDVLNRWEGDQVLHNSRFDINWMRKSTRLAGKPWDPDWSKVHDTLTQAHIDDPTRSRGLKPLGGMLIDKRAATSQSVLDTQMNLNNWTWDTVPIEREGAASAFWIYGALDPVITARLHVHFTETRQKYAEAYNLEMGVLRCIADMEWRGARVDLPHCDRMTDRINEHSKQLREWMREYFGIENATSLPQCIEAFEKMGRTITRFTKSGAKSLDKEQLQTFLIERDDNGNELPGNVLAQALLDLRKGEKQVGPYFSNFRRLADSDGFVHPTIWPVGTRTARMSIQDPALQTLPRGDPTVRDAFIPREGNMLIMCDYDQIEMRLAAHFAQDEGLRAAFTNGGDFFNTVASQAWGDTIVKGDPRRQTMKNGCYGKLYGAGIEKIALTAGVPFAQMDRVMSSFDANYPGIRRLQDAITRVASQRTAEEGRPYVVTPTGRRLYGDKGKEYALTNYLIQSHAAEVLKRAICDLDAAGYGEYMILPVHDELVFDIPREFSEQAQREIPEIMGDKSYYVPLTSDCEVADHRWGDKYRK